MAAFPIRCGCGISHSADAWAALPTSGPPELGGRSLDPDDPEEVVIVSRHCSCGSTISLPAVEELRAGILPAGHQVREGRFLEMIRGALRAQGVPLIDEEKH